MPQVHGIHQQTPLQLRHCHSWGSSCRCSNSVQAVVLILPYSSIPAEPGLL